MRSNCPYCISLYTDCRPVAANDNDALDAIIIPPVSTLCSASFLIRLAIAFVNLSLPRRSILRWLYDQYTAHDGLVLTHERRTVRMSDIDLDETFGTDQDPSERWLSDFLRFAVKPPRQNAQLRIIPRIACLYLGIRIAYPEIANHLI